MQFAMKVLKNMIYTDDRYYCLPGINVIKNLIFETFTIKTRQCQLAHDFKKMYIHSKTIQY